MKNIFFIEQFKALLYVIGLFLFILTCNRQQSYKEGVLLTIPDEKNNDPWFNNHLELEWVVPIETTEEFLLGTIKTVIAYKDKLTLLSDKKSE